MASDKQKILRSIYQLPPSSGQYSIENLCLRALQADGVQLSLADEEYISRFRKSLFNEVFAYQEEHVRRGGMTSFFIADRHALRIRLISEEDGFQAFRRAQLRSRTLRWLTQLSDRQYEFASGKAMESLGSNRVRVTAGGNEYGMDFLAIVPAFSINPLFLSKVRGIRIIGQAKKYSDPVSRDKIQSFNDCVSAVKYGNGQAGRVLPAWFLASDLPILGCYVAHSGFQAGARKLANEMGHILLDSVGLAEIIANPRSFDIGENLESIERTLWGCLPGIEKKFAA